jgi:hypothetical protein
VSLTPEPADGIALPDQYEIRLSGHLPTRWEASFDGFRLTRDDDGTTVLHGAIADQAALHGVLRKVRDLGVPLISVTQVQRPSRRAPPLDDHGGADPS